MSQESNPGGSSQQHPAVSDALIALMTNMLQSAMLELKTSLSQELAGLIQQRSNVVNMETDDGTASVSTVGASASATQPIVQPPTSEPLIYSVPQGSLKKDPYFLPLDDKIDYFTWQNLTLSHLRVQGLEHVVDPACSKLVFNFHCKMF